MKKEELFIKLGDIDDKLIEDAKKPPRIKRKKLWYGIAAAAAAGILIPLGLGFSGDNSGADKKLLLAAVTYPDMPDYPGENAKYDEYSKWVAAKKKLRDQPDGYKDGFDEFFLSGLDMFLKSENGENTLYSPLNLYMALGITAEITDGNTRKQLLDALYQENIDELNWHAHSLWQSVYMDDGIKKCVLGNSVWLNKNIDFNQDTINTLASNYYAESYAGAPGTKEFNRAYRDWINSQTDNLLKDYVDNIELSPDTVLSLISTINFKAKWTDMFKKQNTIEDIFHSYNGDTQADYMNAKRILSYSWGVNFSAISFPFYDAGEMRFILPDDGVDPESLLADDEFKSYLISHDFEEEYKNKKSVLADCYIPKFDISCDLELGEKLQKLGITDLFDKEKSDFSPLTTQEGVYLSNAKQQIRVAIDEEGCKAVSAVEMMLSGSGMPEDEIEFRLDRPFIFEIESPTGTPLFVGIVNEIN